ncbi:general stress protein [Planococcus ruber]|uniref:general stress protein n=1 Tax=Planococcus ruber TaxID=2027871 RepID=UPI001FEDF04D|nr:general stress protein [Planococcus ruber]MCJ1906968.1 general stress protein [Planococcus ruber]
MATDKRVLAVVYSENDLLHKLEELKKDGYEEKDLHILAKDSDRLDGLEGGTDLDVQKAGSFKDKFKGFITGEGSVLGTIKSLDLSKEETERYTEDLAKGGILIYADERKGIEDVVGESAFKDREGNPVEPSQNEFVNSVDNNFDEQEDRFARGETFQQDPTLMKDPHHVSFSTQQKPEIEKERGSMSTAEKHSSSDKKYK